VTSLREAEGYCATPASAPSEAEASGDPYSISVAELGRRKRDGTAPLLLDVRLPQELAIVQFPDAKHIPMHEIPRRFAELDPQSELAIFCHHGTRSAQVVNFLLQRGFARPRNLEGGIDRYAAEVDPKLPRY
jgi:rhodanese-related sulfurtransferase